MLKYLIKGFIQAIIIVFKIFAIFLIPLIIAIICIILVYIYQYYKIKFIEKIHIEPAPKIKLPGLFTNLFWLFPKQLAYDNLHKTPGAFEDYGIHIVVGEQGAGKTMTVVYLLQKWQKQYPKLKVFTNMDYKYQNGDLTHWKQLITRKNDIFGVVNVIDEIKTWFSNRESKNVPPEVLGEICQQRKQRKAIVGTVQVFSELAKPFRSQTHYVYTPMTIFGCLTLVWVSKPKYYNEEKDTFKKHYGLFVFAHTKELRTAYDTYKKIEKYKNTDFSGESTIVEEGSKLSVKVEASH